LSPPVETLLSNSIEKLFIAALQFGDALVYLILISLNAKYIKKLASSFGNSE
jgi:hypothetical protein